METLNTILKITHVVTAMLMIWPFYNVLLVNHRLRLGPPIGDRVDVFLENIIRNRTSACMIFQLTALTSGVLLVILRTDGMSLFLSNFMLAAKAVLMFVIMGFLSYVRFVIQPAIDLLLDGNSPISDKKADAVNALRRRRKIIASWCAFLVFAMAVMGLQIWNALAWEITLVVMTVIGLFVIRAYRTTTPHGWV